MEKHFEKYVTFSASDFAQDENLIIWVLEPDEESNAFWQSFLLAHPQQEQNIESARTIIIAFMETVPPVSDSIKDSLWEKISNEGVKGKVRHWITPKQWLVAASLIVAVATGFLFIYVESQKVQGTTEIAAEIPGNDSIVPGGEKATLTLSDGSTIVLDSARRGELSQQGNARLIILPDGGLAYKQTASPQESIARKNTVATPRGGRYQLQLADGSRVWLNAASSITYPVSFSGNERRVAVTGEVYFEVAHNPQAPFYVKVNDLEVKVLGTRFNLNAYGDDGTVTTTLLEGSVQTIRGSGKITIKPGEQVVARPGEDKLSVIKMVDTSAVIAWKEGYFEFSNFSMASILNEISRWYDVDIILPNTLAAGEKYGGRISKNLPLDELLKLLESSGMSFSIQGRKIIVTQMKNRP